MFTAQIDVFIDHVGGPAIDNRDHVLAWLTVDNSLFRRSPSGGLTFSACPDHADPDDCDSCPRNADSVFSIRFISAS